MPDQSGLLKFIEDIFVNFSSNKKTRKQPEGFAEICLIYFETLTYTIRQNNGNFTRTDMLRSGVVEYGSVRRGWILCIYNF
jgi:hypothetical protein